MPGNSDLTASRREQILDAAEKVFSRMGFNQARMDDIVAESSLSKGALYWYFKSKDDIIHGLLERVFTGEMRKAESLIEDEGVASERIEVLIQTAIQDIKRLSRMMPLAYEFIALAARRQLVRSAIRRYYAHYQAILSEIIRQGMEAGEFEPGDPDDVAVAAIGFVEGMALMWFLGPGRVDWDRMGDLPNKILLQGIRKKEV